MEIGGKLRFSHKVKSTSFGISLSLIASKVTKKYGYPIFISLIMLPFQIFFLILQWISASRAVSKRHCG